MGCHRPRIPDRVVFEKLVQVLGSGCAYERIADATCSATTLREAVFEALGGLPEGTSAHLDRGCDSDPTRERLANPGLRWEISGKGKPAPLWATRRWVVERTSSWHDAHKKPAWCTERAGRRVPGGVLRRGEHREEADPRRLEALPLGGTASTPTVTYPRGLQETLREC